MSEKIIRHLIKHLSEGSKLLIVDYNAEYMTADELRYLSTICSDVCYATNATFTVDKFTQILKDRKNLEVVRAVAVDRIDFTVVLVPAVTQKIANFLLPMKSVRCVLSLTPIPSNGIAFPKRLRVVNEYKLMTSVYDAFSKNDDIVDNTNKKFSFFIVNYNTTDYIHLLVSSIHKFVKSFKYDIWIFDNSDKEKLVLDKSWKDVHIIDNTKGQLINYDKEVYKYCNKEKSEVFVGFISVKHALAVQYGLNCPDISDDFILCDSDVVLKKDIDFINDKFACIGKIRYDGRNIPRLLPFLCYINKRTYRKYGLTYFDPTRFHGCILPDGSSRTGYDTGGCLFEDIVCKGLEYRTVDIFEYCVHFGSGSRNDGFMQKTNFNFKTMEEVMNKRDFFVNAIEYKLNTDSELIKYEKIESQYAVKASRRKKYVIYTCITGGYDSLIQQDYYDHDNFDYVCFTDSPGITEDENWKIVKIDGLSTMLRIDNTRMARFVKTHPHLFLKGYERSIWIDGNVRILSKDLVNDFVKIMNDDNYLLTSEHPHITNVYTEIEKCAALQKDDEKSLNKIKSLLYAENYYDDNEHVQTNIILRNHNDEKCKDLMERWWKMIKNYSKRDQTSFNYVFWKYEGKFMSIPYEYVSHNLFSTTYKHNA